MEGTYKSSAPFYCFEALWQMSERTYLIIGLLILSVGRHVVLQSPALRGKAHVQGTETFQTLDNSRLPFLASDTKFCPPKTLRRSSRRRAKG